MNDWVNQRRRSPQRRAWRRRLVEAVEAGAGATREQWARQGWLTSSGSRVERTERDRSRMGSLYSSEEGCVLKVLNHWES